MTITDTLLALHFLRPYWLLGIVVIIALYVVQLRRQDLSLAWKTQISAHLLSHMIVKGKRTSRFNPVNMLMLTGFMLCIAMAGPSWQKAYSPLSTDQSALVIALDVSRSMEQGDIGPTRLQRSKQKIADLLALRGDANTALIVFSGSAHTVIPLANDREVMLHFIDSINRNIMPVAGDLPEMILPQVDNVLTGISTPATVLLITDGISNASSKAFEQAFNQQQHQLLVLGIGKTEGELENMQLTDANTSFVPLDEASLLELTNLTHGEYHRVSHDKTDVDWLNRHIDNHFLQAGDDNRPWQDGGYALVLVLMALFLNWFRKGWSLQW